MILLQKRQFLSEATSRIIAISPMIKTQIQSRYSDIPRHKIIHVQNPTDLSRFNPENRRGFRVAERNKLGLKDNDIAILFAGNNFRLKGLYPLIQSLKILERLQDNTQSFKVLVAGNESPKAWERVCKKVGVSNRVAFLGAVKEMTKLYAASDIFVLPTFYDSASLVILEALAAGLPVITSEWNGTSVLIDNPSTGMVLKNNDNPREIAQALYAYFPWEKREKSLEASPKAVVDSNLENHVDRILETYREVMMQKTHE
jgi:UDP-glucose:(heptosyl)LPS alpha-1,3-glucosyltransferase